LNSAEARRGERGAAVQPLAVVDEVPLAGAIGTSIAASISARRTGVTGDRREQLELLEVVALAITRLLHPGADLERGTRALGDLPHLRIGSSSDAPARARLG
jgi:hypothetical protein